MNEQVASEKETSSEALSGLAARLLEAEAARQAAESRLQLSQVLTRAILDSVEVGILQIGPDGQFMHANSTAKRNLELEGLDLTTLSLHDLDSRIIRPDGSPLHYEDFPAVHCMHTHEPQDQMTLGMRTSSGEVRWGVINVVPVIDPQTGELDQIIGTFVDVSHTKQVEESLRESEERYRRLVEQAPDAILVHHDLKVLYINDAGVKLWGGKSSDDFLGRSIFELVHPRDHEALKRRVAYVNRSTAAPLMEQWHMRLDGRPVRVEVTGIPCTFQGKPSVQTIVRDVTQRKRVERQVRRQREILRKFFDRVPILVGFFDSQGRIKLVNQEWKRIFEWQPDLTLPALWQRVVPASQSPDVPVEGVTGNGMTAAQAGWRDVRMQAADGRSLDMAWTEIVLSDGTQIEIGQDVTARKEAELVLRRNQAELEQRVQSRTEQLTRRNLELQSEIGERRRIEAQLRDKQRFLERLLDTHERDRQLISYEIHDGFLQDVIGSLMFVDAYCDLYAQRNADLEQLELARKSLRKLIVEARRLISGLRPPIIDEQGVVAAIEYLVSEANTRGLNIHFEHDVRVRRLPGTTEAALFRIAQEGLTNIERHSQAHSGTIALTQTERLMRLEIHDSGVGFDPEQIGEGHYGLQGIQERARLVGGAVSIVSGPGQGTHVVVEIPLPPETPPAADASA